MFRTNLKNPLVSFIHSNFHSRFFNKSLFGFSVLTSIETVFSMFDHLWTQDSTIFLLTFGVETGPYIDQGGLTLRV